MKTSIFARRVTLPRVLVSITVLLFIALVTGCASVNRLREAQDAFNQAAAAENAQRLESNATDAVANLGAVRSGYASALLSLEKIESADQTTLQRDGLWGTALTLRALCQWRLGQFQPALDSAAEAQRTAADQIYPRDHAILLALPGLIKTDQAYAKTVTVVPAVNQQLLKDVEALLTGPNGAVLDVQRGRDAVDRNHPVQVYLIQAQLAAYRNVMVARDRFGNPEAETQGPATPDPARVKANEQLKELNRLLGTIGSETARNDLVNYWVQLCALTRP